MFPFIKSLLKNFLHILFPVSCPVCGRLGEVACDECIDSLRENEKNPLQIFDFVDDKKVWLYHFASHDGAARELVLALKYAGSEALGRAMGAGIGRGIQSSKNFPKILDGCTIIPLPLHRGSGRKFNQARAIADGIARVLRLDVRDFLVWRRNVEGQTGKSREVRESLPKDVFVADKNMAGKKIVIVDDVCTTGTTLRRAIDACRSAGAESVGVIVWARSKENF